MVYKEFENIMDTVKHFLKKLDGVGSVVNIPSRDYYDYFVKNNLTKSSGKVAEN